MSNVVLKHVTSLVNRKQLVQNALAGHITKPLTTNIRYTEKYEEGPSLLVASVVVDQCNPSYMCKQGPRRDIYSCFSSRYAFTRLRT